MIRANTNDLHKLLIEFTYKILTSINRLRTIIVNNISRDSQTVCKKDLLKTQKRQSIDFLNVLSGISGSIWSILCKCRNTIDTIANFSYDSNMKARLTASSYVSCSLTIETKQKYCLQNKTAIRWSIVKEKNSKLMVRKFIIAISDLSDCKITYPLSYGAVP